MPTPNKKTKMHTYLVKCEWRATALLLLIEAKNELQAWHKGWGKVSRMQGGDDCLKVIVKHEV